MIGFVSGVRDVVDGFRYLRAHPRLWRFIIAPAIVTLVLAVGAIVGIAYLVDPIVGWLAGELPSALSGIGHVVLTIVVVVALGVGALAIFVPLAGVVAGPFNELLSERVEQQLTGAPAQGFSAIKFVRDALIGVGHALQRLFVAVTGAGALVAVNAIPVAGTLVAGTVGALVASRAAAYDCYDAVLARRRFTYAEKLAYLEANRARTVGLGAVVTAMLLVPGLNLVALGVGAVGATLAAHTTGSSAPARKNSASA
jgi:CysZ protein